MNAGDLFRKLGTGAKFDFNRFKTEAEKLKLVKSKEVNQEEVSKALNFFKGKESIASTSGEASDKHENYDPPDKRIKLMDSSELAVFSNGLTPKESSTKKKKDKKSIGQLARQLEESIARLRKQNRIRISGTDIPPPISSFEQLRADYGIGDVILKNIASIGYVEPTPVQMQVIPVMMQKRQLLTCAPTGSGKTAAFLIPIIHQLKEAKNSGFRAVIVSPTRELAKQTYRECLRLIEGTTLRAYILNKIHTAAKKFKPNSSVKLDILVTTPNRLVYLINCETVSLDLTHVEWLIIDESDKLFEAGKKGFRDQLANIHAACDSKNLKRAMFSATATHDVEEWSRLNLDNLVTVTVGTKNSATELVEQQLLFVGSESGKLIAFRNLVKQGLLPPVLVFVESKERAKDLFSELIYDGINVDVIHSDRTQLQRDNVVRSFRSGKIWVLICTELMGRGIDFKGVNLVVNYDFPPNAISYIHRIGRSGRAGRSGKAITFFTEQDADKLRSIAQVMKDSGCEVPDYMLKLNKPKRRKVLMQSLKKNRTNFKGSKVNKGSGEFTQKTKKKFKESLKSKNNKNTPLQTNEAAVSEKKKVFRKKTFQET